MKDDTRETRIPLAEERVRVDKRVIETGIVTIKTSVDEHKQCITAELLHEEVGIERVPFDREVSEVAEIRLEG
jgi:uncharacterized protein (TIGR02271 family)